MLDSRIDTQTHRIPCVLMRAGTSRGPFFLQSDLPEDEATRNAILLSAMGSGHELQVDGLSGGNPLTSKVPHAAHRSFAVTGAVGLATACATPGTIPHALVGADHPLSLVSIEHPSGKLDLSLSSEDAGRPPIASLLRTARKIFDGAVFARSSSGAGFN